MIKKIQSRMTSFGMVSGRRCWVTRHILFADSDRRIAKGLLVTTPLENQCAGPADSEININ